MKIVKNGRLFGKLNIVDVLILLVVIAAVAFLAVRMVGGSGGETIAADEPSAQANLRYTVLCEDMPLMQAENAVTAVTAEDYELKLDDDSILKVSPNQIFNSNKFQDAQITSAEILPQDDSADGQRVTVRFVIEAAAKNTVGSFVVGTQESASAATIRSRPWISRCSARSAPWRSFMDELLRTSLLWRLFAALAALYHRTFLPRMFAAIHRAFAESLPGRALRRLLGGQPPWSARPTAG